MMLSMDVQATHPPCLGFCMHRTVLQRHTPQLANIAVAFCSSPVLPCTRRLILLHPRHSSSDLDASDSCQLSPCCHYTLDIPPLGAQHHATSRLRHTSIHIPPTHRQIVFVNSRYSPIPRLIPSPRSVVLEDCSPRRYRMSLLAIESYAIRALSQVSDLERGYGALIP